MRALVKWLATGALLLVLVPIITLNIERLAEKYELDQFLVRYSGSAMTDIAAIAREFWFLLVFAFVLGATGMAWLMERLPGFVISPWSERKKLELHIIANVAADRDPYAVPINKEPELSYFRFLKDEVEAGRLHAEISDKENPLFWATVTFLQLQKYEEKYPRKWIKRFLKRWARGHPADSDLDDSYTKGDVYERELIEEIGQFPELRQMLLHITSGSNFISLPWRQKFNGSWKYLGSTEQASAQEKKQLRALKWLLAHGCVTPVADASSLNADEWMYTATHEAAMLREELDHIESA